ncbi:RNA polymerase sigma-70 factor [Pedobacter sp.]|jgi:RNA polymerase sigma-70 factor (family 1)|uniref:RNA polymerase sigma factor n=1 Tax=Pedobacter sp. TaxID=1411316 RepID=UPI002C7CD0A0|nr:RNA polymerase sigma-70 factor [Pedobacter sp.]HWW42568.1 RNA polymerase sigma-70 factor [Pedobacter sp.]
MKNCDQFSDAELILQLKLGNENAFTEIYNRYWEILLNAAYQRLRSREDAEEVVQEVLVSLYFRRKEIDPKSTLEAYLKTALKFKVIDAYRLQQLHYKHLDHLIAETTLSPVTPDDQLEIKEFKTLILSSCKKLPEKCREVFMMFRFEELSHQEIAERSAISISTVKKHLHKAMVLLREEFKGSTIKLLIACLLFLPK